MRTEEDSVPKMVLLTPLPVVKVSDDIRISDYSDVYESGIVLSGRGLGYGVGYNGVEKKLMGGGDNEAAMVVSRPIERKDSMEGRSSNHEIEKNKSYKEREKRKVKEEREERREK